MPYESVYLEGGIEDLGSSHDHILCVCIVPSQIFSFSMLGCLNRGCLLVLQLEENIGSEFGGFKVNWTKSNVMMASSSLWIMLRSGGTNHGQKHFNPFLEGRHHSLNHLNSWIIEVVRLP